MYRFDVNTFSHFTAHKADVHAIKLKRNIKTCNLDRNTDKLRKWLKFKKIFNLEITRLHRRMIQENIK